MRLVTVLDCVDADGLADFWSTALGCRRDAFGPPDFQDGARADPTAVTRIR